MITLPFVKIIVIQPSLDPFFLPQIKDPEPLSTRNVLVTDGICTLSDVESPILIKLVLSMPLVPFRATGFVLNFEVTRSNNSYKMQTYNQTNFERYWPMD